MCAIFLSCWACSLFGTVEGAGQAKDGNSNFLKALDGLFLCCNVCWLRERFERVHVNWLLSITCKTHMWYWIQSGKNFLQDLHSNKFSFKVAKRLKILELFQPRFAFVSTWMCKDSPSIFCDESVYVWVKKREVGMKIKVSDSCWDISRLRTLTEYKIFQGLEHCYDDDANE